MASGGAGWVFWRVGTVMFATSLMRVTLRRRPFRFDRRTGADGHDLMVEDEWSKVW